MSLPVVEATVLVHNQDYDKQDPTKGLFQIFAVRAVEVVQLNLNSGGMRVRFQDSYQGKAKTVTQDVGIAAFFAAYAIVPKELIV